MKVSKSEKKNYHLILLPFLLVLVLLSVTLYLCFYPHASEKNQVNSKLQSHMTPIPSLPNIEMTNYTGSNFTFSYPTILSIENSPYGLILNSSSNTSLGYIRIVILQKSIPNSLPLKSFISQDTKKLNIQEPVQPYAFSQYEAYSFGGGAEENDKYVYIKNGQKAIVFVLQGFETGSSYRDNPLAEDVLNKITASLQFN